MSSKSMSSLAFVAVLMLSGAALAGSDTTSSGQVQPPSTKSTSEKMKGGDQMQSGRAAAESNGDTPWNSHHANPSNGTGK